VIVVACTDPDKGAMGFLAAGRRGEAWRGLSGGRKLDKIGLDAQGHRGAVVHRRGRCPLRTCSAKRAKGSSNLMQNLPQERIGIAVMAATAMETVLELTLQYTKERKAFGRPVGSQQNSRFLLAELATEATVVRHDG